MKIGFHRFFFQNFIGLNQFDFLDNKQQQQQQQVANQITI